MRVERKLAGRPEAVAIYAMGNFGVLFRGQVPSIIVLPWEEGYAASEAPDPVDDLRPAAPPPRERPPLLHQDARPLPEPKCPSGSVSGKVFEPTTSQHGQGLSESIPAFD